MVWEFRAGTSSCRPTSGCRHVSMLGSPAPFTLFPDFRNLDRGDGNHCVEPVPAFAPVQGQLLGAGRPANRARIQLICSLTDSPITALALRPGYLIKSTRSFCLHSRATTVSVKADSASGSASPLINSKGP